MVSCNSATHATYLLALTTYKYSELQVFSAIQKLSYKAIAKHPFSHIVLSSFAPLSLYIDESVDENCNLDIFKMTTNINELMKKLVNRKLLIFKRFQMNVKDIKCHYQWLEKHEFMFLIIRFLAYQILSIIGAQINVKRIFFFGENVFKFKQMLFTIG
jgi:hypothetical protein